MKTFNRHLFAPFLVAVGIAIGHWTPADPFLACAAVSLAVGAAMIASYVRDDDANGEGRRPRGTTPFIRKA